MGKFRELGYAIDRVEQVDVTSSPVEVAINNETVYIRNDSAGDMFFSTLASNANRNKGWKIKMDEYQGPYTQDKLYFTGQGKLSIMFIRAL